MTGRGLFRMVAALVLVAVPLPGGPSLRGEDDTVVDAAAKRAQEQGQQQQQVVLDQQMNGMFYPVEGNAEKSRQQCLDRLLLQVSALDEICGLKAEQRRKCEAAAKLDVARAMGLGHVAGCTGSTSEDAVRAHYGMPLEAMLDMGDFAGGLLKYLRSHPVARVTIGGGFGKITKLGQGALDLHSGRSQVDMEWLAALCPELPRDRVLAANTAHEVLEIAGELDLAQRVAEAGLRTVREVLRQAPVTPDVIIVSRQGEIIAHAR